MIHANSLLAGVVSLIVAAVKETLRNRGSGGLRLAVTQAEDRHRPRATPNQVCSHRHRNVAVPGHENDRG